MKITARLALIFLLFSVQVALSQINWRQTSDTGIRALAVSQTNIFAEIDSGGLSMETIPATTAPAAPQNLNIVVGNAQVTLRWNKNKETGFLKYRIYIGSDSTTMSLKDSTTASISDTTKTITGLINGTMYYFRVSALDSARLESRQSILVSATPTIAPSAPTNLIAVAGNRQVVLFWNKNTETDFLKYRIYISVDSVTMALKDSSTASISDTSKTIIDLTDGTKYYFRITAVNSSGLESGYSNEASTTPFAFFPPTMTSFTPTSGPIGTMVTIIGTNFNPTLTNNIVYFGAVRATVTAASSTSLSIIVPTGATYAPITLTDVTKGSTAYSAKPFVVTFPSSQIVDTTSFATKVDFASGNFPNGEAIGDIDSDGKPDLVIANFGSGTISVLRNTSTSGAIMGNSFATMVDFASLKYGNPESVAIGDIDGDGKPDIAVANSTGSTVSVYRNTSLSGAINGNSFATKVDFITGGTAANPVSVVIRDIDGDGKPDIVVANQNLSIVSIFRNTSTSGTITSSSFATKVDFATDSIPSSVAIGDIDGDGKPDIVVANYCSNTISILRNTSFLGAITFAKKVDITTSNIPKSVAMGDIDGDGKPDIVVANYGLSTVSVYHNISTSGAITSGSFAPSVDFITGYKPNYVAIGDLNGDGKPDLAVTGMYFNTVSVLRNTSTNGTITSSSFATKVDFITGNVPLIVAIGDIDGDGKSDLVVTNAYSNTVSIFRNAISGPSSPPLPPRNLVAIAGNGQVSLFWNKNTEADFLKYRIYIGTDSVTMVLVDSSAASISDTTKTIINLTGGMKYYFRLTAVDNSYWESGYSNRVSATPNASSPPTITSFSPTSGPAGTTVIITGTNFSPTLTNNIVYFGTVRATVTGATSTSLSVTIPTGATYQPITATNLMTGLTAYSTIPFKVTFPCSRVIDATSFAAKTDFGIGTNPFCVAIGDIDGDGKLDLVTTNHGSNTVTIKRNTGARGNVLFAMNNDYMTGEYPWGVALGDLDGDGKLDIIVSNWSSNTVSIFRNTSTSGSISFASKLDYTVESYPARVAIGDIDGDGKPDFVVTNKSSNTVSVFHNTGTKGNISFAGTVDFATGNYPCGVAVGDLDGDGRFDLVVTNEGNRTVSLYRNTSTRGNISFATKVDYETGSSPWTVTLGDLDGDRKLDMAVSNSSDTTISVYQNLSTSGNILFASKVDYTTGKCPYDVAIEDINGDGKPDLATANYYSHATISVLKNTSISGGISFAPKMDYITGSYPYSDVIGDIDGDGKPDLVVANYGSNTVSILRNIISDSCSLPFPPRNLIAVAGNGQVNLYWDRNTEVQFLKYRIYISTDSVGMVLKDSSTASILDTSKSIKNLTGGLKYYFRITVVDDSGLESAFSNVASATPNASSSLNITSFTPTRNALNVAANTNITITFNNEINPSTFANSTIKINGSISGLHTAAYSYDSSIKTVTITPASPFQTGDVVTTTLTCGIKNGAGDSLATSCSWNFTVKTKACSGIFYQSSTVGVGNTPWYIAAADFDKDGAIDLAVVNNYGNSVSILKNDGSGSFTLASTLAVGSFPCSIIAADLDGDGYIDLAVTNGGSGTVSLLRNNGNGTFTRSDIQCNGTSPWNVAAIDVDGDGDLDLTVANFSSNSVSILKNDGNGAFSYSSSVSVGQNPYALAILDLEGDGVMDLAVTNYTSNSVSLLKNDGSGIFTQISIVDVGNGPVSVLPVNIDGDNTADLVVSNAKSRTVSILKNNGSGVFSLLSTDTIRISKDTLGTYLAFPAVTDIDGDGSVDLIVPGVESITVLKNNGTGMFVTKSVLNVSKRSIIRMVVAADFNNDGQVDFAGLDQVTNSILIFNAPSKNASLRISSSALSFGILSAGSHKSQYLKIYNDGTDSSLVISSIVSFNPVFVINRTSLTIPSSGSDSVQVTFSPTQSNLAFNDSLLMMTNDPEKPMVKIFLSGATSFDQPQQAVVLATVNGPIYAGISILGDNVLYAVASGGAVYRMNTSGTVSYTLQVNGDIRSSSSIAYDTTVYIASSDRNLYAFSKDGNSVWSPLPTGGVLTATPVVDSITNRLYIGISNNNFIAVNRLTGIVAWNYFADDQIKQSAVVTSDRKLVFVSNKGTLYGFNLNGLTPSAAPAWQIALPDTAPSPLAVDAQGYIYLGTSAGNLLKILLPGEQPASIVWQTSVRSAITSSPVIDANGIVYVGSIDSMLYAVDSQTGVIKWEFATKGPIRSTPTISDLGNIYVANDSGEVYALDKNKDVLWKYQATSAISAPLLHYKSHLYVGTQGHQILRLCGKEDSTGNAILTKTSLARQTNGQPMWSTFQGNSQRTGVASVSYITGITSTDNRTPSDFFLLQNYPNPFNPSTTIKYELPTDERVSIKVFNMLGQQLLVPIDGFQSAGYHQVTFDTKSLPSGIYFYQMTAGSFVQTKKMILMK